MKYTTKASILVAPRRRLSVLDAACILIGVVVGIGIFRAPSVVAAHASNEYEFIGYWLMGGILSLVGALCYAELGATYPHLGGEYHFLTRAYGKFMGFFFGWARLSVIQTGAIATVAFVLGDYMTQLWSLGEYSSSVYAAVAVISLTLVNVRGLKASNVFQNTFTLATVFLILCLIIVGLIGPSETGVAVASEESELTPSLGAAMIFVLLTFGGWNEAVYLAAEVKNVKRNLLKSLVLGLAVVILIYILLNIAYLKVLGLENIRNSDVVAADMMRVLFGEKGAIIVSAIIAIASLSTLNATIFTGSRTNTAFGRDFSSFRWLGEWNSSLSMPTHSLLAQAGVCLLLVGVGATTRQGFVTMVEYTAPVFWLFFLLTSISIFILRSKDVVRPAFSVPLYPVLPIIFSLSCAYMFYASVAYTGFGALLGLLAMIAGVPVHMILSRQDRSTPLKLVVSEK